MENGICDVGTASRLPIVLPPRKINLPNGRESYQPAFTQSKKILNLCHQSFCRAPEARLALGRPQGQTGVFIHVGSIFS
jgi:hypothetical protein